MHDHQPSIRTRIFVLMSFFAVALPAISLVVIGYVWFFKYGLQWDIYAQPQSWLDRLCIFAAVLPLLPLLVLALTLAAIPWMRLLARCLSWADIEYFTKQKGAHIPLLSPWLERLWLRIIAHRRPEHLPDQDVP